MAEGKGSRGMALSPWLTALILAVLPNLLANLLTDPAGRLLSRLPDWASHTLRQSVPLWSYLLAASLLLPLLWAFGRLVRERRELRRLLAEKADPRTGLVDQLRAVLQEANAGAEKGKAMGDRLDSLLRCCAHLRQEGQGKCHEMTERGFEAVERIQEAFVAGGRNDPDDFHAAFRSGAELGPEPSRGYVLRIVHNAGVLMHCLAYLDRWLSLLISLPEWMVRWSIEHPDRPLAESLIQWERESRAKLTGGL